MKRLIIYFAMVLILVAVTAGIGLAMNGNSSKYAILVGAERLGADDDVRCMTQILKRHGFRTGNIKSLINKKATMSNLQEAFQWVDLQEDEQSTVVFLFSGHGNASSIVLGDGFYLGKYVLNNMLAEFESDKQLVCIQACYSGDFIVPLGAEDRIVISSSKPGSISVPGKKFSVWGTYFLHYGFIKELADLNHDGRISIEEAKEYAGLGVMIDNYEGDMFLEESEE